MSNKEKKRDPDHLDWDSPIEPGNAFVVLPEGLAEFEVLKFAPVRKEMGKLGVCNVAVVTLLLKSAVDGTEDTKDVNLPLHRKMQFKLYQFFTAIGQRKHGDEEAFVPNWKAVEGETGKCMIKHRAWTGRDGKERTDYDVEAFLTEEEASAPAGDRKFDNLPF